MTRLELLNQSSALLGRFAHEVKVANAIGLFDINTVAEDFLIPIFAIAFNCPDLCNQNRIKMNFPAIDLGCKTTRTSIQITSDSSSSKVCETLDKFKSHGLSSDFDLLYVYVITERQRTYTSKKLIEVASQLTIKFDPSNNILDFQDLVKMLGTFTNEQLERINGHLEAEFKKADANLQFRSNLDAFLGISHKKIEDEKRTKKYIPSVFVETSEIKEEMRYFANPMFFYRKIDDDMQRLDLDHFNKLLEMAKIEQVADNLREIYTFDTPNSLSELQIRLARQYVSLRAILKQISPFSGHSGRAECFAPSHDLAGYWEVFRCSIQSNGSGVFHALEKISKKIRIAQAKIFLVTGMAGQGKTNFICDLVSNQFRAFEIPTIFIPARLLNDYPSPNRILSYIRNNRYAPEILNLHDLFTLLNRIADECKKPFIIVIDGINEVSDLDGFVSELRVFFDALCQYEFIKTILTCRNEFFDHKFAKIFYTKLSDNLYRVCDLRREMSEDNKSRLLKSYLSHFKIKIKLSKYAADFLKNDLILLRIFSEIHEGKDIGYVSDVYKGDIFEGYLIMKIKEFPTSSRQMALRSLYKICSRMLNEENFSQISLEGFDDSERHIIERLIGEDIILRREVPSTGLASLVVENVSFTYDELRDFLLAYYIVVELSGPHPKQVKAIFEKISEWPIYEGFFRYSYILARKQHNETVIEICEASDDFIKHYLNNLSLLSSDIQNDEDVNRIKNILKDITNMNNIQTIAWFLCAKRDDSNHLNIQILIDHIIKLNDIEAEMFFKVMFSGSFNHQDHNWRDRISLQLSNFNLRIDKMIAYGVPMLVLVLHLIPYASWDIKERMLNFFAKFQHTKELCDAIDICKNSASVKVHNCLKEMIEELVNHE